jgi:predicted esterase
VDEFIKENGPFDGLLGFSQGASMAHLLICLHQRKGIEFIQPRARTLIRKMKGQRSIHLTIELEA